MLSGSSDTQILHACRADPAFRATRSPYLVLDRELRIVGANPAYCEATLRTPDELAGRPVFEVFPENPELVGAGAAAAAAASLERVLRSGVRDHLPVLRYDVPAPAGRPGFVERVWVTVNSPLRDRDGRVIGVLHHAEDVTGLLDPGSDGPGPAAAALARALDAENAQLRRRFARHTSIEQAKGALMAGRGCTAEEAFALLRRHSHDTSTTLHAIADAVLRDATGRPDGPPVRGGR
nr:ANTAR domain-containing protein [Pseudonocardia sp. C8]